MADRPQGNQAPPDAVRAAFDGVAPIYDRMNLLISVGQEPRWRRRVVRAIRPRAAMRLLDVACGTGTLTADLHRAVATDGHVIGVDFSSRMIEIARRRHGGRPGLEFLEADALDLPLPDASFDAATIAFGIRNVADYERAFAELRRVVRPGGTVACLEIARPRGAFGAVARIWFDRVVPMIGRVAGHADSYAYLVRSTRAYPPPEAITAIMRAAGLDEVRVTYLTGGVVTLHVGTRPLA